MAWKSSSAALTLLAAALGAETRYELAEPAMGTLARITFYASDSSRAGAAFARIRELDAALSDYKPDSELNRLCRSPAGTAVPVSADLFAVLERAQEVAELSGGAFDATLGPLTHLWRRKDRLPGALEIAEARRRTGWRLVKLDARGRTVTLAVDRMQLDLGGIAKGYAANAALAALRSAGITRALVAVSGDLAIGDAPPGQPGWRIGIGDESHVRVLSHVGVSTSGDAEQFVTIGGVRHSHILDPATGTGVRARPAITVIAQDATLADGLATAISAGGRTFRLPPGVEVIESVRSVSAAPHTPSAASPAR